MNTNEVQVELLNACKYETKEDKKKRTMIGYRILSEEANQSKSDKFKGYAVLNAYFDGHEVYDKIPNNYFGKSVKLVIKKETSPYDPMREVSRVVKINDIDLV